MKVTCIRNKEDWNAIIKSFKQWDIYYLFEYAYSLQLHGDGSPCLIYAEKDGKRLAYVVMENDIADFWAFDNYLQKGKYYDWTTPYGYGGPLTDGEISAKWIKDFMKELMEYCNRHFVVSQFFRFHPLLQNQKVMQEVSDVVYLKKTVYLDTIDEKTIYANMTPNNRNMIRKAQKNNIKIIFDTGERVEEFTKIYELTMRNNKAEEYYYFEKEYFDYLIEEMRDNIIFFYALYHGIPVSASLFFVTDSYMHYHLSGTLPEYRNLAATNLLLSEAANWAAGHGIKELHLGGGVGVEDSLLTFKKHFNRNGLIDFCIGRNIFMPEIFEELVNLRAETDGTFDREKPFMIQYRG